jgi:hypothetical protein
MTKQDLDRAFPTHVDALRAYVYRLTAHREEAEDIAQETYRLRSARRTMIVVFQDRCALVSKRGVCHQCTELNGFFNPEQTRAEQEQKLRMVRERGTAGVRKLYGLRAALVRSIDPLNASGSDLHDTLMQVTLVAVDEEKSLRPHEPYRDSSAAPAAQTHRRRYSDRFPPVVRQRGQEEDS